MQSHNGDNGVTVVVATRDRPELLRRTLRAIAAQDHDGPIDTIIVFDRSEPDESLISDAENRTVRITTNSEKPGLAGARNTGMGLATHPWIAFCDDDDEWLPSKIRLQVQGCVATDSGFSGTGSIIVYKGKEVTREATSDVAHADLLRSRHQDIPASSFMISTELLRELGGIDEALPESYAEDYDLMLRASEKTSFFVVPSPQVRIYWHGASFFFERWKTIDEALGYLLEKHQAFTSSPKGLARIKGQQAIAQAEIGDRRRSIGTIGEVVALNWREPRWPLAILVCLGLPANVLLKVLHKVGRGI